MSWYNMRYMEHKLKRKLAERFTVDFRSILLRPQPEVDKLNVACTWSVYFDHAMDIEDKVGHLVLWDQFKVYYKRLLAWMCLNQQF